MRGGIAGRRAILAAALLFASLAALAEVAVPPLDVRVIDLTATLTPDRVAALDDKLAKFERRKGSQIALLLVPTTQLETIEQYSIRVVDQWQLGRAGVDDGVLLLVAKDDRALRIEVGRGLEGALPDATANRIIDEYITPAFKQGDFDSGLNAGVDRIIQVVDGEPLPEAEPQNDDAWSDVNFDSLTSAAVLVLLVGGFLRSIFGLLPGSLTAGALAGAAAGLFGAGVGGGILLAVIVFVLCLIGVPSLNSGGGFSSGRGYSGRSGGGGFSGGGGGFGGGGASGRW